jgi:polyhydroxybutyrate depolymerase
VWRTLTSGGLERGYLLARPEHADPAHPAPLILEFHGLMSNAEQQAAYSGLAAAATRRGFVVVTPQGSGRVPHWNYPGTRGADDVRFVDDLVAAVGQELAVDERRIFAAGISNGAGLVMTMVSRVRHRLAGVAAVAGANIARAASPTALDVLVFHGTADGLIPYAGGRYFQGLGRRGRAAGGIGGGRRRGPVRRRLQERRGAVSGARSRGRAMGGLVNLPAVPVEQVVADWARIDGCTGPPATTRIGPDVRHVVYAGGRDGTGVELYAVDGGGHVWPGARDVPAPVLGRTTHTIDATALIVERWSMLQGRP